MAQKSGTLRGASSRPLRLSYAHGLPLRPVDVRLHEPRWQPRALGGAILAVVQDEELDESVADLGHDLAVAINGPLYIVRPLRVPAALPLQLSPEVLDTLDTHAIDLEALEERYDAAQAFTMVARRVGPALVAEAVACGCAGIVIAAPPRQWLARWRRGNVEGYLARHAPCRVYVVQEAMKAAVAEREVEQGAGTLL